MTKPILNFEGYNPAIAKVCEDCGGVGFAYAEPVYSKSRYWVPFNGEMVNTPILTPGSGARVPCPTCGGKKFTLVNDSNALTLVHSEEGDEV